MDTNLNTFIKNSISLINDKSAPEVLKNAPDNPCIIVFLDDYSASFTQVIYDKMVEHWGHKAGYIYQILFDGSVFYEKDESNQFSRGIDIYDLIEKVMDNEENTFPSPDEIKLFFVLSTNKIESIDGFKKLFDSINIFKSIESINFLSMFVLMEDASIRPQKIELRDKIRRDICESAITQKYDSVFILSNMLSGGSTLRGDREAQNYSLLANIIVIANNDGLSKSMIRRQIYFMPSDDYVALTASYLLVEKPVKEIVITSYYHIIRYITDEIFELKKDYRIPQMDLISVLQIDSATGFEFINNKLEYMRKEYLPNIPALKMLPNMNQDSVSIKPNSGELLTKDKVFSELDLKTFGAWSAFYEENFISVIKNNINAGFMNDIKQQITKSLSEHFSYAELSMLMESGVEYLIESNKPEPKRTRSIETYEELYSFIIDTIRAELYDELKPVFIDALRDIDQKAEKCNLAYESLKHELINLYDDYGNSDRKSIETFYGGIVRNYVNSGEISKKIRSQFRGFDLSRTEIQEKLFDIFKNMVEASPEFKYSFEEELNKRLAETGELRADKIISATLESNDDKIIRLKSPTRPSFAKGFYLAKQDSDYMGLIKTGDNMVIDTSSRKSAENIRLYMCEYRHLIRE